MKPQTARWIFYLGTTLSLVLFLGLTADTHRQVRALTHADRLTDQVVAGKKVWHKYNCNDCHTILGFGSYYGPDLTMVFRRRGEARIRTAVMTPEKTTTWRKMPHTAITETELTDLVAFFQWVGEIDTHDWPPQDQRHREVAITADVSAAPLDIGAPPAATGTPEASASAGVPTTAPEAESPDPSVARAARRALAAGISTGAQLFREKGCFDCHRLERVGSEEGPDLTRVGARLSSATIDSLLVDPTSVKADAEMPQPELSAAERAALVRFLAGLRDGRGGNGR